MSEAQPKPVREPDELDAVLDEPVAVLYKHSPLCGASAMAARQVRAFLDSNPGVPVYLVDVIRDRPVAREVTRRLSVRHKSPQALVLRDGAVVWKGSHTDVTAEALARHLPGDGAGDPPS
ncbi:MAG: bacillithiol system redox-active protein YtxJ [Gemmatimonadota bacterium]